MRRSVARFAVLSLGIVVLVAIGMSAGWSDPPSRQAAWASAAVALVTQLCTLMVARAAMPENTFAGWGAGMLIRLVVLIGWGFAAPRLFGLPLVPAMVGLAVCLFLTSVIEPLFLKA